MYNQWRALIMSTAKLVKWGNSVGIRIPMQDVKIANAHVGEQFQITANTQGGFTLTPIKHPQAGWLEAFNAAADDDNALIDHLESDFDKDEWTW